MPQVKIGVIGGTGLYDVMGLVEVEEVKIDTPFGKPSDTIVTGRLDGVGIAFLPRHGQGHTIMPTEVPSRANIYALKSLGVESIIATNSVGSLRQEIKQGDLVIPDQLIDRTKSRVNTFFGDGIVAHIQFAEPFCPELRKLLYNIVGEAGASAHPDGTYLVMEGPAFSTKAESHLHRSWGADVIGMTALPEAKLAREAEICYAIIACATDYDVWHEKEEGVGVEVILKTMRHQEDLSKQIIKLAIAKIVDTKDCQCSKALRGAIVTTPEAMPEEKKKKLNLLIKRYIL
jgi:5'-methylthioadenosine phosphorylase